MKQQQIIIGTVSGTTITKAQLTELLEAINTGVLSTEAKTVYEAICTADNATINTGITHPEYEHGAACPECNSNRVYAWTIVSDEFHYEDGIATGIGHNEVHETIAVKCKKCGEKLYESPSA
jgi:DNA-directed RNA polymerase subunit RPC12/RpoP